MKESISALRNLRYNFFEEEPNMVLHSDSNVATKWRFPAWNQAILNEFAILKSDGYTDVTLQYMLSRYKSEVSLRGWGQRRGFKLTEREDINISNLFLDEAISYLESRFCED